MVGTLARQSTLAGVALLVSAIFIASTALADGRATDRGTGDAEAARRAYEADMLARARAEAEERRLELERHRVEDEARLVAEEAKREEEARRLAVILEKARAARELAEAERRKRLAGDAAPKAPAPQTAEPAATARPSPTWPAETTVTVLLVMQPGTRGIRRHNRTADPVLCTEQGCYISRGSEGPAELRSGRRALGFLNTFGGRAGACRDQLACIFRGVRLEGAGAHLQPVDLRIVRHDRREPQQVTADSACRIERGQLACSRAIEAADYIMWIVPERLAEEAGAERLEAALTTGLVPTASTADADFWRRR
jgi:colicin import membrane protein